MLSLKNVRDDDLLRQLSQLVGQARGVETDVVAHIGEVELRRLYAREACSSMFEYCRRVLGLRENEAYLRITVARAARENPVLLDMLRDGGRCAYRDKRGRRCAKRHDLEFHHKEPFARSGDHSPGNLTLLCRAHNTLLAEQDYGKDVMARFRASASRSTVPGDAYGDRIAVQPRWRAPG